MRRDFRFITSLLLMTAALAIIAVAPASSNYISLAIPGDTSPSSETASTGAVNQNSTSMSQSQTASESDMTPTGKAPAPRPQSPDKLILGFYTAYNASDHTSLTALTRFARNMNAIATVTFNANSNGSVSGIAPSAALSTAAVKGISSFATVTDDTEGAFNGKLAHRLLTHRALANRLENQLTIIARKDGYEGIDIDFEDLLPSDRRAFTAFVTHLAAKLHTSGKKLMVSVSGKTSDEPTSAWDGGFDYAGVGKAADYVQLMTYDEHGTWSSPGPVAGFGWVQDVVEYAFSKIPSSKIILGVASYGYDWNLTTNKGNKAIAWKNTSVLMKKTHARSRWDSATQSPYIRYTASNGAKHIIWYENAASIEAKDKLVNQYHLGGVAMWRMGLENASFWKAVSRMDE